MSAAAIAAGAQALAQAWEQLSGQTRCFTAYSGSAHPPPSAEFSFVIPMTVQTDGSTFAVGVLIEHPDASTLASSMFGNPAAELCQADLADACSELCNILSDSIARTLYAMVPLEIGLPFLLNANNYAHVFGASGSRVVYQSPGADSTLTVLVFQPHSAPP